MTSLTYKLLRFSGLIFATALASNAAERSFLLHDLAHGQTKLAEPMKGIANRLGLKFEESKAPITAHVLANVSLLYVRAPSKEFTAPERESIVGFVQRGGSLLLVLDEENRQSLAVTHVNDLIAPFGLKLTPDLPYLHNCGAISKVGLINAAERELPYSGGRAVEGGEPFAFVLDKEGKSSHAFAASTTLPNGAKIIVMGEGMASLFLGKPEGVRLSGVDRDFSQTTYWGKDSAPFMEEIMTWFMKK